VSIVNTIPGVRLTLAGLVRYGKDTHDCIVSLAFDWRAKRSREPKAADRFYYCHDSCCY
jgi:hypothetical protein